MYFYLSLRAYIRSHGDGPVGKLYGQTGIVHIGAILKQVRITFALPCVHFAGGNSLGNGNSWTIWLT